MHHLKGYLCQTTTFYFFSLRMLKKKKTNKSFRHFYLDLFKFQIKKLMQPNTQTIEQHTWNMMIDVSR